MEVTHASFLRRLGALLYDALLAGSFLLVAGALTMA